MSAPALTPTQQAHDYLTAVERELDDLPAEERTALVEDLALHLEALGAEDDDRPIAVRLGPPAAYAADLRSAAGLPVREAAATAPALRARLDAARASVAVRRLAPAARQMRRLLTELRPAWWVLRGYLLVLVPCLHTWDGVSDFPVPAPLDSHLLGGLLVVAAVVGSVALGRRRLPRPLRLLVAALGIGILCASYVAWDRSEISRGADADGVAMPAPQQAIGKYPLLSRYGPVTDVFPYAADGTPLEGVLLYDQDGRPLQVGVQEWWPDNCLRVLEQPLAVDGVPVPHSFPQSYELYGEGVDLNTALPAPDQCTTEMPRPEVPLPVFPPTPTPTPSPEAAAPVAPAPGD